MDEAFYIAIFKFVTDKVGIFFKYFKKSLIIEEIKKRTQVLFVDDESFDSLLDNIREAGWNARQVRDINNLDIEELKNADIIFIDYKNVGVKLTPTDEGIGLIKLLRRKYPDKYLIFYSGYAGFIPGHEFHDITDGWIIKSADPYIYIERIEAAAKEIYERK